MKRYMRILYLGFKRLLETGIVLYLLLIPAILITGGFKLTLLGTSIKAFHLEAPIKILLLLLFLRVITGTKIKNSILILTSIFITLAFVEIALRIWNPPIARPEMGQIHRATPVFGWELIPGSFGIGRFGESYEINPAGFRDVEYPMQKPQGIRRIMVIGDSFTFGMGVNLKDTYPKKLEDLLNGSGIAAQVINCGVIGYDMWQYCEMLETKVPPYQPDLIILGLFEDDLKSSVPPYKENEAYQGENPFQVKGVSAVISRISLYNFLRNISLLFEYKYRYKQGAGYLKGIEERKKIIGPDNPTDVNYRVMSGKIEKEKLKKFSDKLAKFVSDTRKLGGRVLVVMIPDSVQLNDYHLQAVNRFVKRLCNDMGVPFLDTTPMLEQSKDFTSLYLFPFDAHNSPKGLRIIAEAIARQIIKLELLTS
jgi:hypothetical protein